MKKRRYVGLNKFNECLKYFSIDDILNESFRIYNKCNGRWYPNPWVYFDWAFGNAWRNCYHKQFNNHHDIASTFPLSEVLSTNQIQFVAQHLKISVPYFESGLKAHNTID